MKKLFLVLTFLLASIHLYSQDAWQNKYLQCNPLNTNDELIDIAFIDDTYGYAIAMSYFTPDYYKILKSTDKGNSWQEVYTFYSTPLTSPEYYPKSITAISNNYIAVVLASKENYPFFTNKNDNKDSLYLFDVSTTPATIKQKSMVGLNIRKVIAHPSSINRQVVIGSSNNFIDNYNPYNRIPISVIKSTTDCGLTWRDEDFLTNGQFVDIERTEGYFLVFSDIGIVKKSINGTDWTGFTSNLPLNIKEVEFSNSNKNIVYAKDNGTSLYFSSDGGVSWVLKATYLNNEALFAPLAVIDNNNHYFAKNETYNIWNIDNIRRITDNIYTPPYIYETDGLIDYDRLLGIKQFGNFATFCYGHGTIYKKTDWTSQNSNTSENLIDIAILDQNNALAISNNNVYQSVNSGADWNVVHTGVQFSSISFVNSLDGYLVTKEGDIFNTDDGGQSWNSIYRYQMPLNKISAFYDPRANYIFASGNEENNKTDLNFIKSTDGGVTWNDLSNYLAPSNVTGNVLQLQFVDENNGWLLTDENLFATTDGGYSWRIKSQNFICGQFKFIDINNGVAIENNNVYITNDGGENWNEKSTGITSKLLSIYTEDCTTICAVGENGLIIRSTDGGDFWRVRRSDTKQNLNAVAFKTYQNSLGGDNRIAIAVGENGIITKRDEEASISPKIANQHNEDGSLKLQAYPNPANEKILVNYSILEEGLLDISLYNVLGEFVGNIAYGNANKGNFEKSFEVSALSSGIYNLTLRINDRIETIKLIINK